MKSAVYRGLAGNAKLRGKKCKQLSCGCCDVVDFRDKYIEIVAEKEMNEYEPLSTNEAYGCVHGDIPS